MKRGKNVETQVRRKFEWTNECSIQLHPFVWKGRGWMRDVRWFNTRYSSCETFLEERTSNTRREEFPWTNEKTTITYQISFLDPDPKRFSLYPSLPPLSPSLEALIKIQDLVVLFLYKEMPAETRGAIQAFVTLLVSRCNNTVFHYHSIAFLNWKTNWNRADCAVSLWFSHSFRNWHSLKMFEFWSKNQRYRQILRLRRVVRPETQFAE